MRVSLPALAALALVARGARAQDATITGKVTNQAQVPVASAVVAIPRLEAAARTTDAGTYRLVIPSGRFTPGQVDTIRVTRVGFAPRSVAVTLRPGANTVDIALSELAIALNEVVVSGTAGNQERRAQAATVATVDVSTIVQTAPISNVQQLLTGRVPGVNVTQMTGSSGGTSLIRIRGVSSISLSNDPLVFIDGVRMDNRNLQGTGSGFGSGVSTLNSLDPNEIESIEVVKGPAAATLYGADASAGVIQIITKRGRAGSNSFSQTLTGEYARLQPNYTPPSNFAPCPASLVGPTSPSTLCRGQAVGTIVSDNPIEREGVLGDGSAKALNWSGRGGGQSYGYYLAYGYNNEVGTAPQNGFNRQNARANFNFVPRGDLTIDAGFGLSREINDQTNVGDNLYGVLTALIGSPVTVGTASNGWFAPNRDGQAIGSIINRFNIVRFTPNVTARYRPTAWFTNRLTLGTDLARIQARQFFPKNARGSYGGALDAGQDSENRQNVDNWTLDYLADFKQSFGADRAWAMDLSLGAQVIAQRNDVISALAQGFVTNSNTSISSGATTSATGQSSDQRSVGYIGQWQVGWRDRLFLQLGARIDQNSAFGNSGERFFLPKVGASYVLSDEKFWQDHVPFIGTFRLRAAYGTTGRSPNAGASLQTYTSSPYVLLQGQNLAGVVPQNPGNEGLRAERGTEIEAGFDAGFFHDRMGLEFSYFDKVTKDLILQRPIPPSLGFTVNPFANIGEVVNRGVEVALHGQIISTKNVAWESRASVATLHNRLTSLGGIAPFQIGLPGILANAYNEGDELGAWYGQKVVGYDAGAGKAIVTDTAVKMGSPIPTYSGNVSTDLTLFHNLRFSGLLEFSGGSEKFNAQEYFREKAFTTSERFQKQASLTAEERARLFGPYVNQSGNPVPSSVVAGDYLQDASFARLREASLTYTLPASIARMIRGSNASITVGGRNLALWTNYRGDDPESLSYVPTDGRLIALDFLVMPQTRRYFARFNVGF
jgi:TonB-linked SusC/RagA family outer membrane protein